MVRQPLAHPLRAYVSEQRGPAVQILVLGLVRVVQRIQGVGFLDKCFDGVGEVEPLVAAAVGGSDEEELAAEAVAADGGGEGAIDYYNGVDTSVAPVGEDFVASGGCGGGKGVVWDPLALVGGGGEAV